MTRELVFIHGRSQQKHDPAQLKKEWLDALALGLARNDPPLPAISEDSVRFPYYGDTLDQMVYQDMTPAEAPEVIIRGDPGFDDGTKRFMLSVLDEVRARYGVTDEAVIEHADQPITERGPLNWTWVRAILQKLDTIKEVSAATIALVTLDVYQYLTNAAVRMKVDSGVSGAMTPGVESVVVGHSLGSVVAYTLLQREGGPRGWNVPLFVTVGCPLAVNAIRTLAPGVAGVGGNRTPGCAKQWFNAMDSRDVVALYPLDVEHFQLNPPAPSIENKTDVNNDTDNRHGIRGYLSDPVVARRIYEAVNQT